jgi:hypothetical protein
VLWLRLIHSLLAWLLQGVVSSSVELLTVIVYDLYTLDNTGHGFEGVITQNVLFTSRRELNMDVVSSAEQLCFHVWLILPGSWFQVRGVDVIWMADCGPSDRSVYGSPARLQ